MKKSILVLALLLSSVLYKAADAQVSVNINIGQQPVWGPVGYDYVEYYYFPDADIYYNVPRGQYVYFDGREWVFSYSLPGMWSDFDLYNSYKVVINEPNPFYRNDYWRSRYMGYRGRRQDIIYYSREPKYFVIQNHPEHNRWVETQRTNDYRYNNRNVYNDRRDNNDRRNYDNRVIDNRVMNDNRINQGNRAAQTNPNWNNDNRSNRVYEQQRVNEASRNNAVINQGRNNEVRNSNPAPQRIEQPNNNRSNDQRRDNNIGRRGNEGRF